MAGDEAVRFIVATYGTKHLGMLLAHLWSITRSHPAARATIYWQDIPAEKVGALQAAFPTFDFRETRFDFSGHWVRRIAAKMRSWSAQWWSMRVKISSCSPMRTR
jgi:hypothetical protein